MPPEYFCIPLISPVSLTRLGLFVLAFTVGYLMGCFLRAVIGIVLYFQGGEKRKRKNDEY